MHVNVGTVDNVLATRDYQKTITFYIIGTIANCCGGLLKQCTCITNEHVMLINAVVFSK